MRSRTNTKGRRSARVHYEAKTPGGQVLLGPIGKLCKNCRAHLRVAPVGEQVGDYIPLAVSAPALPIQELREEFPGAREHVDWCIQKQ